MKMSEKYERQRFIAAEGQQPLRVDKFLQSFLENTSRSRIQRLIREGLVWVNHKVVKSNFLVRPQDVVVCLSDDPPREYEIEPEDLPIDVVYEDEEVLVIDKKPGMVVHPGHGNYTGTLVHALAYRFRNLPLRHSMYRHGLVHRIDKDTSGLLVVAKTEKAMAHLSKQFLNHTIDRKYKAFVWGALNDMEGTITNYIGRSNRDRRVMQVLDEYDQNRGKKAVTHYKILERCLYATLIECRLETGRTHQIRVHFQHLGHPLFGDLTYGIRDPFGRYQNMAKYKQFIKNCFATLRRQALHAFHIGFDHPSGRGWVSFDSPLPEDFSSVFEKWKRYTG